jgi:hypothetical protein
MYVLLCSMCPVHLTLRGVLCPVITYVDPHHSDVCKVQVVSGLVVYRHEPQCVGQRLGKLCFKTVTLYTLHGFPIFQQ